MKYIKYSIYFVLFIVLCFPIISANAITCNNKVLNVSDESFRCNNIDGDKLIFTLNGIDYSKYFSVSNNVITISNDIKFPTDIEIVEIEVKDATGSTTIKIKNDNYVTTTTTTTTKPLNTVVVTFDKNDGSELSQKKCSMIEGSNYCSVVLPKLNLEGFSGWGTQKECKEGISGTVKIYKDIKYYACYKFESKVLKLDSLEVLNKSDFNKIDFDEFSSDKFEYNIKVLYEIESVLINALVDDSSIKVTIDKPEKLEVGHNKVYIKLNDGRNNETIYTLNIERLKDGEPITKTHYLSSLVIGGSDINFNKDIFEYNVTIDNEITQLEITKIPFFEDDITTVRDNYNLVNGSKVFIDVTGDDGETSTYTINIIKVSDKSNTLLYILIPCAILLIILVLIIVKRNKKDNKEVRKNKEKIRKVKNKAKKNNQPEVLNNDNKDDIEVLKF